MLFKIEIIVRTQPVTKEAQTVEEAWALVEDAFKDGATESAEIRDANGKLVGKYLRSFRVG